MNVSFQDRPAIQRLRRAISDASVADESDCVAALLRHGFLDRDAAARAGQRARHLVEGVRANPAKIGLDAFLREYGLSTKEGVALMCLAEALLRIPDPRTADRIIREKLGASDWHGHLGHADSLFVNASTWGLMLTGKVVQLSPAELLRPGEVFQNLVSRLGMPVVRAAAIQAMKILGAEFVLGRTIAEALDKARGSAARGYLYSFDMLGEAALTAGDADSYAEAYRGAVEALGKSRGDASILASPGVSVKLSALHPRYEFSQRRRAIAELGETLRDLARRAKGAGISLCVDAEEAHRLHLSLDLIESVFLDPALAGWEGFGLAVQSYSKQAPAVIDWLENLARRGKRKLMVRLVKGAYWDAEIKRAQELGLDGYPVFTRKDATDASYLVCAAKLLLRRDVFYPQFATHNAHTLAAVREGAGDAEGYEFQRLHGMGEALYDQIIGKPDMPAVRIYAPVGSHEHLLSYLVRRLLENGANTSFVNRIQNARVPVSEIVADPMARLKATASIPHPNIPLPGNLFGSARKNSSGLDLGNPAHVGPLLAELRLFGEKGWEATPLGAGILSKDRPRRTISTPADRRRSAGLAAEATLDDVEVALTGAAGAADGWDRRCAEERAACLERAADLLEGRRAEFIALAVHEAGKTVADALAEVREAVDFCRYYAIRCRGDFAIPAELKGVTGETNHISLHGRGVFVCISPWNFPLAIFMGQVTAALAAGNAVIAKPAEQTPLMAVAAVRLLYEAGVPEDVLYLLPGDGPTIGERLVADPRTAGVAFTGSTETARKINRTLAARSGAIAPLIGETGGQNAMIVDSTALPEQVAVDVLASAFGSAGQRCSALRVLFLQEDVAAPMLEMIRGAMAELSIGDPAELATDVGPVIDEEARLKLERHAEGIGQDALGCWEMKLPDACRHGTFFSPAIFEIDNMARLKAEVFGPILHVVRFAGDRLDDVIEAVNGSGYGLTLGVHSRIGETARYVHEHVRAGNTYVNRNMVGAVVGVQPFGGEGLSGTGPKAGGPRYLHRFATERVFTVNTAAAGGNAALVAGLE